ncbi:MAG: hypothetical protein Kow0029_14000 [Candidatus Rifleibacteriota bacterium]
MKNSIQDGLYAAFDLGTAAIKATIIEVNNSRPRLATIEEEKIKPSGDFPGEDEYRIHLIESLRNIATRLPISECKKVSVLFSHREMQVKIIELPAQVQADQIEKILNWEAKKLLSPNFREEPYSFSYKIVRENPFSVALAVIPTRLLERFLELFEAAGIAVDDAYSEVFSAHSLHDAIDQTCLPALSIVNFGHTGTHLQIFSAGELRFYRFIPSGMSEMSQPPKENELEMYSQKIRFSFDYFRAVTKLNQIDAVFFMGGGVAQPNILPYERSYFNPTRVNIVDISSHIDISPILPEISDNSPVEEKQRRLLPFLPSIGTILTMFKKDSEKMNLALRFKRTKHEKRLQELAKSLPIVIGVAGLIFMAVILFIMKRNLGKELDDLKKKYDMERMNTESVNIKIAKYRAASQTGVKLSPQARKAIAPVLADQHSMAEILYHVVKQKPENIVIQEILVRNHTEADNINFENEQAYSSSAGDYSELDTLGGKRDESNKYVSKLAADAGGTVQYNEGLGGKILIIKGTCSDNDGIANFVENLSNQKIIKRLKSIVSRKKSTSNIEYLLKGEMP